MMAKILDGKTLAARKRAALATEIDLMRQQTKRTPGLAVILVGTDPASQIYVRHKNTTCEKIGVRSFSYELKASTRQEELLHLIAALNGDTQVDGILVQLPLPTHINPEAIIEAIDPKKDVDGFHPYNMGRLAARLPALRPCTPFGCMELLKETGVDLHGLHALIVGASNIVGRPMALELLLAGSTITIAHRFTTNLEELVTAADIVVAAVGKPGLIKGEWIKSGAIVIDVGMNRLADGKLCGDIEFATARQRASWITPVPGGVGPMTIAMLMHNTVQAAVDAIAERNQVQEE
ncbi:MAG: bifunctional methylenetetrahydrofolate dehydrogenase/methenyltetrahydrofolate cyclohydrolase FolD [Mariprofundales bacterium]